MQSPRQWAIVREQLYLLLAKGFDRVHHGILSPAEVSAGEGCLASCGLKAPAAVAGLKLAVSELDSDAVLSLKLDYGRLFFGPFKLLAPPYESVYREGRRVMGDCTMKVLQAYRIAGLAISQEFCEIPDHIVAEMDFMAYLCAQEAQAWEENNVQTATWWIEQQLDFLQEHLSQWVPDFCSNITQSAKEVYYQSLGEILLAFVEGEISYLPELYKAVGDYEILGGDEMMVQLAGFHTSQKLPPLPAINEKPHLFMKDDSCSLCGVCVNKCATGALAWNGHKDKMELCYTYSRCTGCGQCVRHCPEEALLFRPITVGLIHLIAESQQVLVSSGVAYCCNCHQPFAPIKSLEKVIDSLQTSEEYNQGLVERTMQTCPACRVRQSRQWEMASC